MQYNNIKSLSVIGLVFVILAGVVGMNTISASAAPANGPLFAPSSNDNFSGRISIVSPFVFTNSADMSENTEEMDDPVLSCIVSAGYQTSWYEFVPESDGDLTVDTIGSIPDTAIAIFDGTYPALNSLACNDSLDGLEAAARISDYPVTGGNTYYIEVVSVFGDGGIYQFNANFVSSTPTEVPTEVPTDVPTEVPTDVPTEVPTDVPTDTPTDVPTEVPTDIPTDVPTEVPTDVPTDVPTEVPTDVPTDIPTDVPTEVPTEIPTETPTASFTPTATATSTPTKTATPANTTYYLKHTGYYGSQTSSYCKAVGYTKKISGTTGSLWIRVYVDGSYVTTKSTLRGGSFSIDLRNLKTGYVFTTGIDHTIHLYTQLENGIWYPLLTQTGLPGALINCAEPTATAVPTSTPTATNTLEPTIPPTETNTPEPTIPPTETNTPEPTNTPTVTNTPAPTNTFTPTRTPTPKSSTTYALRHTGNFGTQTVLTCKATGYTKKLSGSTGRLWIRVYVDGLYIATRSTLSGGSFSINLPDLKPGYTFTLATPHTILLKTQLEDGYWYNLINPATGTAGGTITCE